MGGSADCPSSVAALRRVDNSAIGSLAPAHSALQAFPSLRSAIPFAAAEAGILILAAAQRLVSTLQGAIVAKTR